MKTIGKKNWIILIGILCCFYLTLSTSRLQAEVKPGDVITLKENATNSVLIKGILEANNGQNIPEWLELDTNSWTARVISIPSREQIDVPVQEHLIVELYSR